MAEGGSVERRRTTAWSSRGARRGDAARRGGHELRELQGRRAPIRTRAWRPSCAAAAGKPLEALKAAPRRRAPAPVPARAHRPRGRRPNSALPTDERLKKFDGANDPALAALALPVRPLPAHLLVAAGHAAGQPPGHLEQGHESHVGFEVHDQHQHGDELLAGRGRRTSPSAPSRCSG
ncbi:MAG: hypothetical protein M0C28_40045 [Candidatus Moduliflexus flocculans]|nr:hypothetical protein [Candidatus Moduliflexus flocculans]